MPRPAVLLAVVGLGPCVSFARKLNVPALRASQTLTRSMRPSKPTLRPCAPRTLVRLAAAV